MSEESKLKDIAGVVGLSGKSPSGRSAMGDWTPGPWRVQRDSAGRSCGIVDENGRPINWSHEPNCELGAGAPEMAELLDKWQRISRAREANELIPKTRALLAKVNGESDESC